eukprot:TRINITY_DN799_c0_g4_i2.p1 TRINITY_DN799_c0_g4~~TRINITY_DN799_c0_g4_i2.p1  ORF type:complete len:254 (-),score=12.42 TRINITY_DN799_c0_g4_i2:48-809(-)
MPSVKRHIIIKLIFMVTLQLAFFFISATIFVSHASLLDVAEQLAQYRDISTRRADSTSSSQSPTSTSSLCDEFSKVCKKVAEGTKDLGFKPTMTEFCTQLDADKESCQDIEKKNKDCLKNCKTYCSGFEKDGRLWAKCLYSRCGPCDPSFVHPSESTTGRGTCLEIEAQCGLIAGKIVNEAKMIQEAEKCHDLDITTCSTSANNECYNDCIGKCQSVAEKGNKEKWQKCIKSCDICQKFVRNRVKAMRSSNQN